MATKWFDKYCSRHYSQGTSSSDDPEFDLFYELSEFESAVDTEKAWQGIRSQIHGHENSKSRYPSYWKVAAVILALISLSVLGYKEFYNPSSSSEIHRLAAHNNLSKYALPDGTKLTLGRNSTVTLYEDHFSHNRNLNLDGKGFFDVTKGSPFVISTDNGQVKVLGTSFDVDTRDNQLTVKVYSGVVEISKNDVSTKLRRGEMGVIDTNESLKVVKISDKNAQSWRTGKFTFNNQSLKEIIPLLEEFYDVDIKTSKAIRECKVTAQFDRRPLTEVIQTLTSILNITSQKSGNKIALKGKGC